MAARNVGADFLFNTEVIDILEKERHVSGVALKDGTIIESPVVVNVAGPHSYLINRMAGIEDQMNIKTRALRVEVAHVPSPEGVDWENKGVITSDSDTGVYTRPEIGNHFLIGSEEPKCDPLEYVDPDNYNLDFTAQARTQVMREAMRIPDLPIPNQNQTHSVSQVGCAISISPATWEFPWQGGSGLVTVSAAPDCDWSVATSDPWVTLTSPTSGTGPGSVSYDVA